MINYNASPLCIKGLTGDIEMSAVRLARTISFVKLFFNPEILIVNQERVPFFHDRKSGRRKSGTSLHFFTNKGIVIFQPVPIVPYKFFSFAIEILGKVSHYGHNFLYNFGGDLGFLWQSLCTKIKSRIISDRSTGGVHMTMYLDLFGKYRPLFP